MICKKKSIDKCFSLLIFICFCCAFLICNQAVAQQIYNVRYSFEKDTIKVSGGQTFSNKLIIENLSDKVVLLSSEAIKTPTLAGMITLPKSINLNAKEKKAFPLKYIADRKTINKNIQAFTVFIKSDDAQLKIQPAVSFYTLLSDVTGLDISTEQSEFYLNQVTGQSQIMLLCTNRGIVPISFRLALTEVPEGLEFTGEEMSLVLQPGAQQLLPFNARNKLNNKIAADFNVTIQAVDQGGNQLALKRIRIMSVSSVRRYGAGDNPYDENLNNTAALRYLSMSQNSSFYQMQANGKLNLSNNSDLHYRFNLDYYQDLQGINLYDSYLDYQHKDWGIKIGSIYENLDYALSGRGAKATLNFNEDKSLSIYGMQNNYMLMSQVTNSLEGPTIIAANYAFKTIGDQQGRLTYLHIQNGFFGVSSHQVSGKTAVRLNATQQLDLEGGYSLEKANNRTGKHAAALGINYTLNAGSYQFITNNYYSTSYYTGLHRGLFQSDNRVVKTMEKGTLSARISILNNSPEYQDIGNRYNFSANKNIINVYEVGYSILMGKINLDFRPYFMDQSLQGMQLLTQLNQDFKWRSSSVRMQANLNFFNNNHSLSINADYGYTYKNTSNEPKPPFHSLRLNSNYSNRLFGFTSYIQLNPYYLSDSFSATENADYKLYSFGPNTSFTLFRNRLNVQLATLYNYYDFTQTKNYALNGSGKWMIKGNWAITADLFYSIMKTKVPFDYYAINSFNSNTFNTRQIRVGIEKQFSGLNKSKGKKLELAYFEDYNNNGIRDPNEKGAEGITVKLNEETARTNSKGTVKFYEVKPGNYTVYVVNSKNWGMQEPISIVITRNKLMEIPLVKTIVLKGKMQVIEKSYQNTSPILSGILVNAKDANGKIYKTLTDASGNYSFYLPAGTYTVFVETEGMSFSIGNSENKVELSPDKPDNQLNFEIKDERRKVGVTRF